MGARSYEVLDVGLTLESSAEDFLEAFHLDYGRFAVPGPPRGTRLAIRFEAGPAAFLDIDGARQDLADHPNPGGHAALAIAQVLMDRVEGYTVLHAAVVGSPAGALALSGPSGAGKTTLTLDLLAAGCAYLSDDFCPLHRVTGLVHPFPRSMWVRAQPGQPAFNARRGKALVPLDGQAFPLGTGPLPLRMLVCLDPAAGGEGPASLRVGLREGLEGPFLEAAGALTGVEATRAGGREWLLTYPRGEGVTARIRELLDTHRAACWNVYSLADASPDFSGEARLSPMTAFEAAFFLLRELKHSLGATHKPGALLHHIAGLLACTACYRLTPGAREIRRDLVLGALEGLG